MVRAEAGLAVWVMTVSLLLQLNILACGVLGSYSVVLAVDSYAFTSLSYITLNVLRRALNTAFRGALLRAPFQTNGKSPQSRNHSDVQVCWLAQPTGSAQASPLPGARRHRLGPEEETQYRCHECALPITEDSNVS